jgi:hypothetical protein
MFALKAHLSVAPNDRMTLPLEKEPISRDPDAAMRCTIYGPNRTVNPANSFRAGDHEMDSFVT